jgi:hypothetical protein
MLQYANPVRKNLALFIFTAILAGSFLLNGNSAEAANGLVGYWKFDETSASGTAADSSGNGNDAVANSLATPSVDVPTSITFSNPRSTNFDGSQYFTIDRPIQDNFTICTWAKVTNVGNGYAHWETAAFLDSELGGLGDDFGFGLNASGELTYGNGGDYDDWVHGDNALNDNAWHHNCVTRKESTGEVVLYVDGVVEATGTLSTGTLDGNGQAIIGYGTDGANSLQGNLDDFRIYDRVLSADEVAQLAAGAFDFRIENENGERASITSWKAQLTDGKGSCPQRLKLIIKGKNFDKDAEVYIGGKKASSVGVASSKRLTAKFCLPKLLAAKTDLKRNVSVKNPDSKIRKAEKKLELSFLPANTNFDQATKEGILNIQKILTLKGFLAPENVTGFYGSITQEAVKGFQTANGIPITGSVGPKTQAAFQK